MAKARTGGAREVKTGKDARGTKAKTGGSKARTRASGGAAAKGGVAVRPLRANDLEAVVAIDMALAGTARRDFYERRLRAALKQPANFIYVGACESGRLRGFALVRLLAGEFGAERSIAVLDAIGVDPDSRGKGLGRALMAGIEEIMRHKDITELHTQSRWDDHELLRFLAAAGFERAPRLVLNREVGPVAW